MKFPFILRTGIQKELNDARKSEREAVSVQHRKNVEAIRDQLEKAHNLEIAKKNAEIESLKSVNEELRDVAREASDLSLKATQYVSAVNQMAIDNGFQSHRMMEAVMKSHQTQLHIAESVRLLAQETDAEMAKGRKRLERGL